MNLIYGPAEENDIEPLFQFNKDIIDHYEDVSKIDYSKVLSWVRNKLQKHIGEYTCVCLNNQKAGYYHFCPVDRKMELDDLYLFPQYRNRGIGSEIIRKCVAGTDLPIFLYVFKKNTGAVSLYQKFGFRITETVCGTRYIMER